MIASVLGVAVLGLLFAWLFGGVVLRFGGFLIALAGLLGLAISGNVAGLPVIAFGVVLWLAGHWHYARRHGGWKSPIAGSLCRASGSVFRRPGGAAAAWLDRHIGKEGSAVDDERAEGGG